MFVGTILYGHCNGFFGRNTYENKRIEALGADWVVAREESGDALFASFEDTNEMLKYTGLWSVREEE